MSVNVWVVKIGDQEITKKDKNSLLKSVRSLKEDLLVETLEHKTNSKHFLSYNLKDANEPQPQSIRTHFEEGNDLLSFSGLVVSKNGDSEDPIDAATLYSYKDRLEEIPKQMAGQYAVVHISTDKFQCIVDFLGSYKIYYYQNDKNEIYLSNFLQLILQFKENKEVNYDHLLTYIAAGGIYGYETNEKDVYTLPKFGKATWSPKKGFVVSGYDSLESLIRPQKSPDELLDETASLMRNGAVQLNSNFNCFIPISGGYDSR